MKDQKSKIIIKKVVKRGGEGGHGGSWKVAYADFVTAMMAFFLLMWLITMVAPEKRAKVATYFKHFSMFEQSGYSFMEKSSEVFSEAGEPTMNVTADNYGKFVPNPALFKDAVKQAVETKLGDVKDQVLVDVFEGGVRIQLVDRAGRPMYDVGAVQPTGLARRILGVIADNLKTLPNPIAVEGHTDSLTFKASTSGNWDLSTERALAAQRTLQSLGIPPSRFSRVAGYADTVPLNAEDPEDPINRRISVILMFDKP